MLVSSTADVEDDFISPSSASWQDSESLNMTENRTSSFDLEYTTNWSLVDIGDDRYERGFGTHSRVFNGDQGELYRFQGVDWAPGRTGGHHLVYRSINPDTIADAVITEDAVNIEYDGNPDDFSWYMTRHMGSCLSGNVRHDDNVLVFQGDSLDEINTVNGFDRITSTSGTGTWYNNDPNRFHTCFILEANNGIEPNQTNTLTLNVTPHADGVTPDNSEWSDPETMVAEITTSN